MSAQNKLESEPGGRVVRHALGAFVMMLSLLMASPRLNAQSHTATRQVTITVTDQSGEAISGAKVTVTHGAGNFEWETGADGRVSIMPESAKSTVTVYKQGYAAATVQLGQATKAEGGTIAITLITLPDVQESVTVEATSQTVADGTSSPGSTIAPAEARESPGRPLTITDALPLVPGVVRAPDGQIQIEGAGEVHSSLIVNSVDVTDPANGQFGMSVPIDVVGTLHVLTSPTLAQYGKFTAGVVTADTRPGGSKWHYDLNDPLPEFRIRSGHLRGLRSMTPRLSFDGPLARDKASISQGLEFVDNKTPIRTLPFPFNETRLTSINSLTQADLTLTPHQTLTEVFHASSQSIRYAGLDYFNPQPTTPDGSLQAFAETVIHRSSVGNGLLQSTLSLDTFTTAVKPQGELGMIFTPAGNRGNYFEHEDRKSRRVEWAEQMSLPPFAGLGKHQITTGSSIARAGEEGSFSANAITMLDEQGRSDRTIDFTAAGPFSRRATQTALFLQDHWSLSQRVALDAGIRVDGQRITATARYAPRLGFIWQPTGDSKTAVHGGVGVFYDSVPLNVYAFRHYPEQTITNYFPDGAINGVPQHYLNVTAAATSSAMPLIDRGQQTGNFAPYSTAWNLEAEHQFSPQFTLRAKYVENKSRSLLTVTPQTFQGQNAFVLAGNGSSNYRQFELSARVSPQAKHPIYISYVRSQSLGTLNEAQTVLGDFSSPFVRDVLYGHRAGDIPNRFLAWGSVAMPWKIEIFPKVEMGSGFPYQSLDVFQNYTSAMSRFPSFFSFDCRIAKDIKVTPKYSIRPSASLTNVTNHFNALEVHSNVADPQYGQFFGNYNRRLRFDLDVVF